MTPSLEAFEAVILSGPRRGEIVTLPPEGSQVGSGEVEAISEAMDALNAALQRVTAELRATLQALRPPPLED
jgi:hypothetical protein